MNRNILVVFDIDGTLTDSVKQHQQAFAEILKDMGVESHAEFKSFKHHTDSFIAKEIYESSLQASFTGDKKDAFEKALSSKLSQEAFDEIKGAKALIDSLKNAPQYGFCFATGSLRRPASHKLNSIGIEFDEAQLVASDDIYEREAIVQQAINKASEYYGVDTFERIVSVGDGLWDLRTANNLNLEFVGVGETNYDLLLENGAETVLRDLTGFSLESKAESL
ncbi:HAD family hydrolase [Aureibacter tunicatorum]|uniref:phosphoglycolate phosphatase n=1 Tax=Aureibacter tunicatorum TaxID=866807 RepID=A0AAE4BTB1_9BACT|nr:HAD hydrolase-like protein [Aureibacter tunicatorum]MDR6240611.1 phosphoglycolate phosphatase-like HAD superfamily hydrolase [Aureibacter tunicatorum]BDD06528.1 hydrolase [Aureibacter tunicatorum]